MVNFRYYAGNEDASTVRCNVLMVGFTFISAVLTNLELFYQQHEQDSLSRKDIIIDAVAIVMLGITTIAGLIEGYNVIKYIYPTQVHIHTAIIDQALDQVVNQSLNQALSGLSAEDGMVCLFDEA